jgi:phage baseplate assembly protein W
MAEKTIALPFSVDPYGKVTVASDQSKIWADRVRSVIGTFLRERVMRPEFGTNDFPHRH